VAWWQRKSSEIESAYRLHHRLRSATPGPLDWAASAVTKFKTTKLILRAFSDIPRKLAPLKITRHTVYKIYN
jgi:hypothetical protein